MSERAQVPCKDFKAEPGTEVVAYSKCQECGWVACQHLSWAPDPDGTPGPLQTDEPRELKAGQVHTGSQNVSGYRPQTPHALALVNEVKTLEGNLADWLRDVYFRDAADGKVRLDPRQVASARDHFEYALYHLNRAIFQPADPIGDAIKEGPR